MNQSSRSRSVLIGALVACLVIFGGVLAGSLTPPGPPAPTMKTLSDVEPRLAIHAADLPLTISTPGSYYLAENITTAGNGITISASNVTIDVKGFTLRGGTGDGIVVSPGGFKSITLLNGTVAGWSGNGINLTQAPNSKVIDVSAVDNAQNGIVTGNDCAALHCTVTGNSLAGISVASGSEVINSTAYANLGDGIDAFSSVLENSAAMGNGQFGVSGTGSTITHCVVEHNNIGMSVQGCNVSGCVVQVNNLGGIASLGGNYIVGNSCLSNNGPRLTGGSGISATGKFDRIEGNSLISNSYGLNVTGTGNTIFRNSATQNPTGNYSIVSGNDVGPIGSAATSASPWANIQY